MNFERKSVAKKLSPEFIGKQTPWITAELNFMMIFTFLLPKKKRENFQRSRQLPEEEFTSPECCWTLPREKKQNRTTYEMWIYNLRGIPGAIIRMLGIIKMISNALPSAPLKDSKHFFMSFIIWETHKSMENNKFRQNAFHLSVKVLQMDSGVGGMEIDRRQQQQASRAGSFPTTDDVWCSAFAYHFLSVALQIFIYDKHILYFWC